jgi:DNA-3-methyladenine glycosylase
MARLARSFFARDTRVVARELLGCILIHILPDGTRLRGRIVETEAYRPGDQASHGYRGQTERNAPMFMRPGTAYVYFTYGMHHCFNISTEADGVGAAVLVRALEPLAGIEVMQVNRRRIAVAAPLPLHALCRGPGNLCKAMALDRSHSGLDLCSRGSPLFIEQSADLRGLGDPGDRVSASPRIGVSGDETAKTVPWRFYFAGNPSVSGPSRLRA